MLDLKKELPDLLLTNKQAVSKRIDEIKLLKKGLNDSKPSKEQIAEYDVRIEALNKRHYSLNNVGVKLTLAVYKSDLDTGKIVESYDNIKSAARAHKIDEDKIDRLCEKPNIFDKHFFFFKTTKDLKSNLRRKYKDTLEKSIRVRRVTVANETAAIYNNKTELGKKSKTPSRTVNDLLNTGALCKVGSNKGFKVLKESSMVEMLLERFDISDIR